MAREPVGKKEEEDQHFIDSPAFKFIVAASLLARPFVENVGLARDLTLPEWRSIVVLHARGELSNSEVADLTGLDAMSVSRALDRLNRNGRVVRTRDPQDGRRQLNRLTASGRSIYRTIVKAARLRQDVMVRQLSEKEIRQFDDMLDRIVAGLREAE